MEAEVDYGDRRLEIHRFGEFLHGAFKTETLQGETGGLLGQVEQLPGPGVGIVKIPGHAHILGALAGKEESGKSHSSPH